MRLHHLLLCAPILSSAALAQNLLQIQPVDQLHLPLLGTNVNFVAGGDIDNDGDTDLAACEGNDAVIYQKQGSQYLRIVVSSNVQTAPSFAAIADIDHDGSPDVLFGPFGSFNQAVLRIWWGDGSGQFAAAPHTDLGILGQSSRPSLSDVDHDGDVDIILTKPPDNQLFTSTMLRNTGNRTFAGVPTTEYPLLDSGDSRAHFIDIDGDTFEDLLFVSRTGRTRLYWNNNGNFTEATVQEFPILQASLMGMALADLDGDGDRDLVFGGDTSTGVMMRCVGPRQFQLSATTTLPTRTVALHATDVDGDNLPDLYVFGTDRGQLLHNDGTGGFDFVEWFGSRDETQWVVPCDLDDDGDIDLLRLGRGRVLQQIQPDARVAVSYTVQAGRLEHVGDSHLPVSTQTASRSHGDINGDGLEDFVLTVNEFANQGSYLQFASNDGRGVFTFDYAQRFGPTYDAFFADLNDDGRAEYVVPGTATSYFANTDGVLDAQLTPLPVSGLIANGTTMDLDGDGDQDLIFLERNGSLARVRILINASGTWQDQTASHLSAPSILYGLTSSLNLLAADFDGDQDADLWISTDNYQMLLRNQNGVLTYAPGAIPPNISGGLRIATGDLDGDGDLDLNTGAHVMLNNGNGAFTDVSSRVPNIFGNTSLGTLTDIDDDGDLDLVGDGINIWNDGHANFSLATNITPVQYGSGGEFVWTDVDRDGDPDLLAVIDFDSKVRFYTNMLRQLWFDGPANLGGSIDFHYRAMPGQTPQPILLWFACSFAKVKPILLPEFGWLQLDQTQLLVVGAFGLPPSGGDVQHSEIVPNIPALRGVHFCAQPIELRGSQWRLGNLVETWLGR
jgi:hypothetical protein